MIDNDTLVSIVVPVYGTEAYLPACIDSICSQSYHNIQVILVDDQSPDSCPEICDRYAAQDPRILVIHQENKGVSGARNTGLNHARGEYILFVDSDDNLYPQAVEILLRDAWEYGADIVSGIKRSMDANGNPGPDEEDGLCTVYQGEQPVRLSLEGERNMNSACAKLFSADLVRDLRFLEGKNIQEDGFFLFECTLKQPVLLQHNVNIYQYNTRTGSGSRENFSDKYLSMLYFCERKKELIAAHYPQYMDQANNMEVRTNLQMLQVLCRTKDRKYRNLQKQCIQTVRRLYRHHRPINDVHRKLEKIVRWGLYPLYKNAVRLKYYR